MCTGFAHDGMQDLHHTSFLLPMILVAVKAPTIVFGREVENATEVEAPLRRWVNTRTILYV